MSLEQSSLASGAHSTSIGLSDGARVVDVVRALDADVMDDAARCSRLFLANAILESTSEWEHDASCDEVQKDSIASSLMWSRSAARWADMSGFERPGSVKWPQSVGKPLVECGAFAEQGSDMVMREGKEGVDVCGSR